MVEQAWNSTAEGNNSMEEANLKLNQRKHNLLPWSMQKFGAG
jgi:hypothetical protein